MEEQSWVLDIDTINEVAGSDAQFYLSEGYGNLQSTSWDIDCINANAVGPEQTSSRKRARDESCCAPGSKACREKMRRDRLNDRFLELGSILDPGRPPKADKATILSDAARALSQLRIEAQKLKEANEKLQETIKDLKVEKNELRDEKTRLKADKERLEQQVKAMSMAPTGFIPHPAAIHAFAAPSQVGGAKAVPYSGYPAMTMWQWMPPTVVDTSQDHKLRPPVA
ncbi:hypothetical protein AMTRI_Chr09g13000 [Amborella trichopoda]|uniref:BHLH domain-containing protein n=1 Tax=Amborella trichopoda TaxID=13333 RepID=W1PP38_AMBTC|nr:transcription factor ILR3 [Amborella trichopoda]XP_011624665.1 transcription factor ILR3 [Amborella trichopoda]ERN09491.1 hypothetical protein AMTR_s00029p00112130 [Amborella trichopoda]|eukprot:XP_006847910.1 transcription factor ILR3 [Amborella trichopoda]